MRKPVTHQSKRGINKRVVRNRKHRFEKIAHRQKGIKARKLSKAEPMDVQLPVSLPAPPLVKLIDDPQLLEMAPLLEDLLTKQYTDEGLQLDGEDSTEFMTEPCRIEGHNNLLTAPLLFLLLADVPVSNTRLAAQLPMIELGTTIPDSTRLYYMATIHHCDESAVELYTLLNRTALLENSKVIADIADAVLYRLAVEKDCDALFPLLLRRVIDAMPRGLTLTNSLVQSVARCAEARLKLMQLQKGAAVSDLDSHVFPGGLGDNFDLSSELTKIITHADATPFQCLRSWLDAQVELATTIAPRLKVQWTEEDDDETDGSSVQIGKMRFRRQKTSISPTSLTALLRDVKRLHAYWIGGNKSGTNEKRGSVASTVISRSIVSEDNSEADDLPDDGVPATSNQPAGSTAKKQLGDIGHVEGSIKPSLIVLPSLPKPNGDTSRDPLKVFREELAGKALPLLPTPDLAAVREQVVTMLPHLASVTDRILNAMAPHQSIKLPPVLLVGPPGCGKTTLLEELVKAIGVPAITIDAAGTADAHLFGTDHRWGNSSAGVHLDLITQHQIANPVIILDELEKLGGSLLNGDARTKLLGFLEPRRASSLFDVFLSAPLDVSALSWMFTANTMRDVPAPLQNRLEIIRCPVPQPEHLGALAPQLLLAAYAERGLSADWCEPLMPNELATLKRHWCGGSIRNLRRLIRMVVDTRDKFMTAV